MTKRSFFQSQPPRASNSFGVAGVLNEGARIYYSHVFASAQIGRVSDLLVARLKDSTVDELRFRALLLYGVFEAYVSTIQAPQSETRAVQVSVECGIDGEKIAVGVSFNSPTLAALEIELLPDRLTAEQHKNDFDSLIRFLSQHSDHVFIRHEKEKGRVEVVSVLGLGISEVFADAPCKVEVVEIPAAGQEALTVSHASNEYIELGDLNYKALLNEPSLLADDLSAGVAPTRVSGEKAAEIANSLIEGSPEAEPSRTLVKGTAAKVDDSLSSIKADSTALADAIRVRGAATGPTPDSVRISGSGQAVEDQRVVKGYVDKITELEMKLKSLETAGGAGRAVAQRPVPSATEIVITSGKSFLSKFWPFKKSDEADPVEFETPPEIESVPEEPSPSQAEEPELDPDEKMPESAVSKLVGELAEKTLTGTLAKAQQEIVEVKKDIPSDKAKRWVDSLMSDFLQEKVRLNELAKKLGSSVRQKEHEFRAKERAFQVELRRRDELIRQKTSAAGRAKDQLAQVNMALERLKGTSTPGGNEDANLKGKLTQSQKYLATAKQENSQLLTKLEDLRAQLAAAQSKARPTSDQTALQLKLDRAQKQADEFKKANLQLLDKLNQTKEKTGESESLELKKRLESTLRLVAASKKEAERLGNKVEEYMKEEVRLKSELAKAISENKRIKATLTKPEEPPKKDPKAA